MRSEGRKNKPMNNKITFYHRASKGGFKQWSIWFENDKQTVTVEWGLVGKTLQTSSDTAVPKGKAGTQAFKNVFICAQENYDKQVRKKTEEGYTRTMTEEVSNADPLTGLTKTFVPAKPLNSAKEGQLEKADAAGTLLIQRKRDGRRHLVLKTRKGAIRIYSRRIEEVTANLPNLVKALASMAIPNGTILDGEVLVDRDGVDDYRATGTFTNPAQDPKESAEREANLPVSFMVFDVLYHNGDACWAEPYCERYEIIHTMLRGRKIGKVHVAENLDMTLAAAQKLARKEKWEGLVCWFADKGSCVRDGGKPKRCNAAKWKPVKENDFIATSFFYGSGELSNVAGGLELSELDPDTGARRTAGKVGTGFNDAMRKEILKWKFPVVVEVKYDKQEPDSGKLRFPVFLRLREDKGVDECIGIELEEAEDE